MASKLIITLDGEVVKEFVINKEAVTSTNPEEVMDWAVLYPKIDHVIMQGSTKTSLLLSNRS